MGGPETITCELDGPDQDPLDALAEEFLQRRRCGERPEIEEYAQRCPELVDQIREVFPALEVLEELGGPPPRPLVGEIRRATISPPAQAQLGDYRLIREIGRGGMGVVYEAEQQSLRRRVALKVLPVALASAEEVRKLRREARAAAQFQHPYIVPVYEVGQIEGRPYFTMKLAEGGSLADRLAHGPLTGRQAAEILIPVCRAIAAAHRGGLVHRDLKPSNILLERDGQPMIADFGLARLTASQTLTWSESIVGTPGYMAPEQAQARRDEVRPASDIYSLGAVLYHMLTGRPPFHGDSPVATLLMALEEDPPRPMLLNPEIDAALEAIVLKCLQKPIALRYGSADELAADLEAYLDGQPVSACSFRFSDLVKLTLRRETRHAPVLQNWGVEWMFHGWYVLTVYVVLNLMQGLGVATHGPYLLVQAAAFVAWALTIDRLQRRDGPVTLIEQQISYMWWNAAHVWLGAFLLEWASGMPPLTLAPLLGVINSGLFLMKANLLSGAFYLWAAVHFACAAIMVALRAAGLPDVGLTLLGIAAWASFYFPGRAHHRRRNVPGLRNACGGDWR
jgi:serine/threonine-protein kinase